MKNHVYAVYMSDSYEPIRCIAASDRKAKSIGEQYIKNLELNVKIDSVKKEDMSVAEFENMLKGKE
jgi:hypothetical protein